MRTRDYKGVELSEERRLQMARELLDAKPGTSISSGDTICIKAGYSVGYSVLECKILRVHTPDE